MTTVQILGSEFVIESLRDLVLNTLGVTGAGLFILANGWWNPLTPTAIMVAAALTLNIVTQPIVCSDFVSQLPSEPKHQHERRLTPVLGEKKPMIHFATLPPEKPDKVFIKDDEESEIFVPTSKVECEPLKPFTIKRKTKDKVVIHRQCEREFVPLKERTKTLADLKDPAQPYLTRHAERFQAKRQKINENREKNRIRVKNPNNNKPAENVANKENDYRNDNWELSNLIIYQDLFSKN